MRTTLSMLGALAVFGLTVASSARAQTCVGDCGNTGMVRINDLILGVNIALGVQQPSACPAFQNAQGEVNIAQLIKGVNNALNGCGGTTPTPTATPTGGNFRDRVFTLDPGMLTLPPDQSISGVFTTGLTGANAAISFAPGPLTLQLGTPDANGVAQLRLKEDVVLEVSIVDGSRLCLHLVAATSGGTIDCNGGTPYDVLATQTAAEPVLFTVTTGLGQPAGPGNGTLLVEMDELNVAADDSTPCTDVTYVDPRQQYAFTTANATSHKDTVPDLTVHGEPFDCATWETPNGAQIAAPAPRAQAPIGPVSNVIRFGEAPPR